MGKIADLHKITPNQWREQESRIIDRLQLGDISRRGGIYELDKLLNDQANLWDVLKHRLHTDEEFLKYLNNEKEIKRKSVYVDQWTMYTNTFLWNVNNSSFKYLTTYQMPKDSSPILRRAKGFVNDFNDID